MKVAHDLAIAQLIAQEEARQRRDIELIASENFVSADVLAAAGTVLTNKYAEGYPGARYYDGCEMIDAIENLAIARARELFNVKYVNVQPHSGSQANAAAVAALVRPGGKIMGLALDAGGHLSHGYKITFSGTFYQGVSYDTDAHGFLDYAAIEALALKEKPALIICGYSAYPRQVDFQKFRAIADKVGAKLMADIAHIAGLVATGLHPSPVGIADVITSTTHKTLRGARGGIIMTNDSQVAKQVDRWVFPGIQGGPLPHIIAAKAVTFYEALQPGFKTYIADVVTNARAFAAAFVKLGVPIITGGTDTHLFTIDVLKGYGISGKEAAHRLSQSHITVNKNTIPHDTLSPQVASGVRLGTPAMTTRGFKAAHFVELATIIDDVLRHGIDAKLAVATLLAKVAPLPK